MLNIQVRSSNHAGNRKTLARTVIARAPNPCNFTLAGQTKTLATPKTTSQVPANDIVDRASACEKDGDLLCHTVRGIAQASPRHEEEVVYSTLSKNGLLVDIPWTYVNLGDDLEKHPCFRPHDLIASLAERGHFEAIIGTPVQQSNLAEYSQYRGFG